MDAQLQRLTPDTFGEMTVGGKKIGVTLEDPKKQPPAGVYELFKRPNAETRHDYDVWELQDVPGRTNIQVHIGNKHADTEGCILIGTSRGTKTPPTISGSRLAYAAWMGALTGSTATLTILDPPRTEPVPMKRLKTLIKSKTVLGTLAGAVAYLLGLDHIGIHEIVQAASPVIAAIGVRDAITKHGIN